MYTLKNTHDNPSVGNPHRQFYVYVCTSVAYCTYVRITTLSTAKLSTHTWNSKADRSLTAKVKHFGIVEASAMESLKLWYVRVFQIKF